MDFSFSDDQQALRELAARVFSDLSTPTRLREIDDTDDHFDTKLWSELGAAGLLGISLPESVGGAGLGFLEACIVAEEAGRTAAAVPLVASTVLGAGPIARFGTDAAKQRYLPAAASGCRCPHRRSGRTRRRPVGAHDDRPARRFDLAHRGHQGVSCPVAIWPRPSWCRPASTTAGSGCSSSIRPHQG